MQEITGFNRLCLVYFDNSLLTTHAMKAVARLCHNCLAKRKEQTGG